MEKTIENLDLMTKEENFDDRRRLFKDIWDTAMTINNEKDDIMTKTKVIKTLRLDEVDKRVAGRKKQQRIKNLSRTLRLDEVDKCVSGRKKKQRIKNLRHVCTKILDFCDKQEADDVFYEQMATQENPVPLNVTETQTKTTMEIQPKKIKKLKKNMNKAKSMCSSSIKTVMKATNSEKEDCTRDPTKTSRNTSTYRIAWTPRVRTSAYKIVEIEHKTSPINVKTGDFGDAKENPSTIRRRTVRKKASKQKKILDTYIPPGLTVRTRILNYDMSRPGLKRVGIPKNKEPLQLTKILIT